MNRQFIPEFPVIPMRKSDPADVTYAFTYALQNCVLEKKAMLALQSLSQLRQQIISVEPSQQLRDVSWKYYQYLNQLSGRVTINLQFTWYDTYLQEDSKPKKFIYSTLDFEKANVMYNMGCCCMALGSSFSKTTDADSLKSAVQSFQQAAGAFQKAGDCAQLCAASSGDLHPRRLQTLTTLALGCAHLIMHINAAAQGKSESLQTKLAAAAANQLIPSVEAFKTFYKITVGFNFLSNFIIIKDYAIYCVQTLAAKGAEEKMEYGEQVKRLKWAMKAMYQACNMAYSSANKDALKKIYTEAKAAYTQAEKNNNNIYMNNLPRRRDLPPITEVLAAKPIELETIENIFDNILPANLSKALNEYNTKAQVILNDSKKVCESKTNEGNRIINSLKGNSCDIPQDIIINANRLKQLNTYNSICQQIEFITTIDAETTASFEKGITALDSEAAEERRLRGQYPYQWKRTASEMAAYNYRRESEKYRASLKQAKNIDDNMINKFRQFENDIKLLCEGNIQQLFGTSNINIEQTEVKWKEIIQERQNALENMIKIYEKNEKEKVGIIKGGNGSNQCVINLLKEFDNTKNIIQQSLFKQNNLFREINNGNRPAAITGMVQRLRVAINAADEILKTLPQSIQFHRDAKNKIDSFQNECIKFQNQRQQEALSMVRSITGNSQPQQQPYSYGTNPMFPSL
ncbi:hypothetical protein ENUP19_0046G0090 [Entamoeba nuttalli]|uniref:Adhesin 112 (EhADH112), putative n=2 Tax=Entamoeba nuttalli TaxID=412467 RepID=K2G5Y4_ENTNP|nr:adhesin 112 (EhADH112), putative [Entamoeba nuttalli P19]EKE37806.1 adhesin 112 (EhADH112), putative [Entamoeba nuttalli P19]|eukprot:XP_008859860.1 adhesin 112 (EhADH112), putative [Entamoeba nuttalli P19]